MNFTTENMSTIAIAILEVAGPHIFEPEYKDDKIRIMENINLIRARSFDDVTWDVYFHDNYIMEVNLENRDDYSLPDLLTEAFWKRFVHFRANTIGNKIWTLALNGKPIEMPEYSITGAGENKEVDGANIKQMVLRYKGEPVLTVNHYPDHDKTAKKVLPGLFNFIKEKALDGEISISLFD